MQWRSIINGLRAHNCQKWKSRFFTYLCHKIDRVEAVGPFPILLLKYEFCMWKLIFLSTTTSLKFESKNPVCIVIINAHNILFLYLIDFQLNTDSPSKFCGFIFYRKIT